MFSMLRDLRTLQALQLAVVCVCVLFCFVFYVKLMENNKIHTDYCSIDLCMCAGMYLQYLKHISICILLNNKYSNSISSQEELSLLCFQPLPTNKKEAKIHLKHSSKHSFIWKWFINSDDKLGIVATEQVIHDDWRCLVTFLSPLFHWSVGNNGFMAVLWKIIKIGNALWDPWMNCAFKGHNYTQQWVPDLLPF